MDLCNVFMKVSLEDLRLLVILTLSGGEGGVDLIPKFALQVSLSSEMIHTGAP